MKYDFKWEPAYNYETGMWYCAKFVYMCPPLVFGEYENETEAKFACDKENAKTLKEVAND